MAGILIVGAGGHGKVVADILRAARQKVSGFLDDDPALLGTQVLDLPVLGCVDDYGKFEPSGLIMGIGSNYLRQTITERINTPNIWITAVHPHSVVSASAHLASGTVIMAGAIINADTHIGSHAIINTGATIDHDCIIGDYAHIGPGVNLAGGVNVGDRALLGVGAAVAPYHTIGKDAVVGAGAVVVSDIPPGVTVVGVPAKPLSKG